MRRFKRVSYASYTGVKIIRELKKICNGILRPVSSSGLFEANFSKSPFLNFFGCKTPKLR